MVSYTPGQNSQLQGGGAHYEDSQLIRFYPGSEYSGTLYNADGSEYKGTLYKSCGHLIISYIGGSQI